ncbi:hypothetical protein P7C73_g2206, partial [Tremellales sp. Uapishka_1]
MYSAATIILSALLALSPVYSAPLPAQVVPNLPAQADLTDAFAQVAKGIDTITGRDPTYGNENDYGMFLNTYVPIATTLNNVIGADNVLAIDVLADRACVAGPNQGSVCNELLSYAYAWYAFQQKSKTYEEAAAILGPNNMAIFADDLRVLCLGYDSDGAGQVEKESCQLIAQDVDVLANAIIGDSALSEDDTNSNTFETYGISKLLPAPSQILP